MVGLLVQFPPKRVPECNIFKDHRKYIKVLKDKEAKVAMAEETKDSKQALSYPDLQHN